MLTTVPKVVRKVVSDNESYGVGLSPTVYSVDHTVLGGHMSNTVTANQARYFRNSWKWNLKHDICAEMGIEKPASDSGKEAWTEFYEDFAAHLDETIGHAAVSATLDYFSKVKKRATMATARKKAGLTVPKGKAKKAAPAPAADPRSILASAFAAGKIDIDAFTAAIAALNAAPAVKSVEIEGDEAPDLDATGSDDLPF